MCLCSSYFWWNLSVNLRVSHHDCWCLQMLFPHCYELPEFLLSICFWNINQLWRQYKCILLLFSIFMSRELMPNQEMLSVSRTCLDHVSAPKNIIQQQQLQWDQSTTCNMFWKLEGHQTSFYHIARSRF